MESFSIVIAIFIAIISLSSERLTWLFKLFLSGITGYYSMKLFFNNLYLWSPNEYTQPNITLYFSSGMFLWSILSILFNLLVFHWIIKIIMRRLFEKPINNAYKRFLNNVALWGLDSVNAIVLTTIKKMTRFIKKYRLFTIDSSQFDPKNISYVDILDFICSLFSISIQVLLCGILLHLGIKYTVLLAVLIILIIPSFVLFVFPLARAYLYLIITEMRHELDKPNTHEHS